ncbi:hypothetical protein [Rhodococcus sp. Q]|uniref:hypothetical protein n=1 Tax=Rhodococcus sp. Q TaxID=2502252 RepID=UPI0010F6B211|nr:hypothetical protein [Rhodococcus sp. Q]
MQQQPENEGPKPGRPRKYASDADRVRAFRARQKQRERDGDVEAVETATPTEAVGVLEKTLTDLRALSAGTLEQFTVVARQITAAVDRLADPEVVDAALHRANVELAQTKAAHATELADLRAKLDIAVDDRANADAAVVAVDAEYAAAAEAHNAEIETLATAHEARLQELADEKTSALADRDAALAAADERADLLRDQLRESQEHLAAAERRADAAEQAAATEKQRGTESSEAAARHLTQVTAVFEQRIDDLRTAADTAAHAATATVTRLEAAVDQERGAAAAANQRIDALRDELERCRIEAGQAGAAEAAQREQVAALREEIAQLRAERTAPAPPAEKEGRREKQRPV